MILMSRSRRLQPCGSMDWLAGWLAVYVRVRMYLCMYIYIYIPWESRYGQRIDLRVSVNFAVTDRTLPPPGAEVAGIQPFKT